MNLTQLIKAAKTFGSVACSEDIHTWETDGGRPCPKETTAIDCSQSVYFCSSCGEYDYGYKSGPGWNDCFVRCTEEDESIVV